jgi:small conductance mechanosensitive channel
VHDALANLLTQAQTVLDQIIAYAPRLVAGLLVGLAMFIFARQTRRWGRRIADRAEAPEEVEQLIINLIYVLALMVALTLTLSVLGVNVYGLVAGLGVSGLVVGFALKDIIENLLAGTLILLQRPFAPGQTIEVADVTGTVTGVKLHATTLITFDRTEVVIPNRIVYTSVVKNYSVYPVRRRQVSVGIGYGEDLSQAVRILLETVQSIEGVVEDPAPFVSLDDFGDSAVAGTLYYFIDTANYGYVDTHTAAVTALQEAVNRHNIDLPYPTSVVINR